MDNKTNSDDHDESSVSDENAHPAEGGLTRRQALRSGASVIALAAIGSRSVAARTMQSDTSWSVRIEMSFDENWLFFRGDASGAQAASFDDSTWRPLDVPHDWRIEDLPNATSDDGGSTADPSLYSYQTKSVSGDAPPPVIGPFDVTAEPTPDADIDLPGFGRIVLPGGRSQGYTVAGIGWYRKRFRIPARREGSSPQVELRFDGVYQNADVWLNGIHLGFHPNGYSSFAYDLTPHLNLAGENILAVRVDNRGKTSRWYSGSGIYRHTWLMITGPVRIPLWGVQVTTPIADARRSVARVDLEIVNLGAATEAYVRMIVLDGQGRTIATQNTRPSSLASGATTIHSAEISLLGAALWSPESPGLHRVRTEVLVGARVVDAVTTTFGIRSLAFNGTAGFLLNGKPYKLRGGNVHHDHGPLGAAAIDRAEERTVEIMRAAGFNAIRAAHNPPSPTMLDTCDRLGILVLEEFSDMWDVAKTPNDYHRYFPEWWQRDLSAMVLRDRNHPSVIYWSIGNEIPSDPNNYGPRLAATIRSLDKTRPVGRGGMNVAGMTGAPVDSDIWSYVDLGDFHGAPPAAEQAAHRDKAFLQSEDTSPQIYDDWKLARDNPWYVGTWIWSGWDYMGESGSGAPILARSATEAAAAAYGPPTGKIPYPWFNNCQGDIDLIGQRKPQNYLRAVIEGISPLEMMVERPTPPGLQAYNVGYSYFDELPSWTWDVVAGKPMIVRVYTSGDSVTLLLNGQPVKTQGVTEADKRVVTFAVPYAPGELVAVAQLGGKEIARKALATTGRPAALRLTSDVRSLTVSRGDLAHVLVEVVDEHGRLVPDAVIRVSFAVEGAGALVGVGNGNPHNVDSFQRPRRWTWQGKALAILRSAKRAGHVRLTVSADEIRPGELHLVVAQR